MIIYSIKLMHHQYNVKNSRIKRSNLCGMKRGDKAKEGRFLHHGPMNFDYGLEPLL